MRVAAFLRHFLKDLPKRPKISIARGKNDRSLERLASAYNLFFRASARLLERPLVLAFWARIVTELDRGFVTVMSAEMLC